MFVLPLPPPLRSYTYSFVKFKTLPFSLLWALTTVSFPSSAADSIDGNNSNGQVHLTGGEYREIVGLGSTVTIGMLPGTPQMQNLIPCEYFGTTAMAAPGLGILCGVISLILGGLYIYYQVCRTSKKGEGFLPTGAEISKEKLVEPTVENEKPLWSCLVPMIVVIIVLNVIKLSAIIALFSGTVVGYVIYSILEKKPMNIKALLAGSIPMAVMPLITVCCASGFGGVVAAVPGFNAIVDSLYSLGVNAFTIVLITNVCAGICGSSPRRW